jgi:hypothetical protein
VFRIHEPYIATMPAVATRGGRVRKGRLGSLIAALREWRATTPGKLLVISVLTVAGAVVFGVVATSAERSRARAASAVSTQTEPLLVQAVALYTKLSDANATATATFATGGPEPPAARAHYLADLRSASDALVALTRGIGRSSQASSAVRTITEQLPVYTGLIETARVNNREGHPVGAAYLRHASALLTGTILPAADGLYSAEARQLTDDYGTGSGSGALVVLVIATVVAFAVLLLAQRFVTRVSRRTLNVPMVAGTIVLIGVSIWAVVGLAAEQSSLSSARRNSDSVEVLSATSVLLSRAQSDQSLTLVNRGSDEIDPLDFKQVMARLDGTGGLVADASRRARAAREAASAGALTGGFHQYRTLNTQISGYEDQGLTAQAIATATGARATAVTSGLNADLNGQLASAQGRFAGDARSATSSLSGLSIAIPLLTAVAAILAVLGLRKRLEEYR